jgi:Mrp family chromosome partitioning ATPase
MSNDNMENEISESSSDERREKNVRSEDDNGGGRNTESLVRLRKTIRIDSSSENEPQFDRSIISPQFYNNFNYWLLPKDQPSGCLKFGVTSAKSGDGKTLVASNLAVSIAIANEKKTLLVDLNVWKPVIHTIFGVPQVPGFLNALKDPEIVVSNTMIHNLSILSAGKLSKYPVFTPQINGKEREKRSNKEQFVFGLERLTDFRDVIYSLEQEFEVVIFDLPTVIENELPRLYLKQIGGIIVVVNSGQTHQEEIDEMLQYIDKSQILGFVMNRSETN